MIYVSYASTAVNTLLVVQGRDDFDISLGFDINMDMRKNSDNNGDKDMDNDNEGVGVGLHLPFLSLFPPFHHHDTACLLSSRRLSLPSCIYFLSLFHLTPFHPTSCTG